MILDIFIPNLPINNEQLSLVRLTSDTQVFINDRGNLCLHNEEIKIQSDGFVTLNKYFRLLIIVQRKSVQIYLDGVLEINTSSDTDQFVAKLDRFELFRETDLTKNSTKEEVVRIQCQSITFLNQSITMEDLNEQMKLPNSSLESLIKLPFSLVSPSLIAIGYKEKWIQLAIEYWNTTNIQKLDTILREQKEKLLEIDLDNECEYLLSLFLRLNLSSDEEATKILIRSQKFVSTSEQVEDILTQLYDSQAMIKTFETEENSNADEIVLAENQWFWQRVQHLNTPHNLKEWIQDKSVQMKRITNMALDSTMNQSDSLFDSPDNNIEFELTGIFRMISASRFARSESNLFSVNVDCNDNIYRLIDFTRSYQPKALVLKKQQMLVRKMIRCARKNLSSTAFSNLRFQCETTLITIYARCTVDNILKIWSHNSIALFPLEKFGDYTFLLRLLRIMDYHFFYTNFHRNENVDYTHLLVKLILKNEIQQIIDDSIPELRSNIQRLQSKTLLCFRLQKNVIAQLIQFSTKPSLFDINYQNEVIVNQPTIIEQPDLNFVFKILKLFIDIIKDQSTLKQYQIDSIIQILFPEHLISLTFDLFLLVPTHESKIFILQLLSV